MQKNDEQNIASFIIKIISQLRIEGDFFKPVKNISQNPGGNTMSPISKTFIDRQI